MRKWVLTLGMICITAIFNVTQAQVTVLQARGYLDVQRGEMISPAAIVIENGIITAVNPDRRPAGAEVIDLGDKYLMPGMMDMHTHLDLDFETGDFGVVVTESGSKAAIRSVKNAEKTLMAGFTTIRNVGQVHPSLDLINVAVAEASEEGWINAPRIIAAGHMISILGGHGDLSMAEGLAEGILELGPEYGVVGSVDDAVKATRFQIKHGAKTIKIHATAGVLSLEDAVGAQQLSDEEMTAIIEEAHRHEIPVAAHAHGTDGIKAAIRAGVNSIDHGSILDDEAIQMMIDHEVVLVPTSGLMDTMNKDMLPPKKKAKAEYVDPLAKESLRKAISAGVLVALGTDSPLIPHGNNAYELTAMMNQGMSNSEALRAATIIPAKLINMEGEVGEIKEGMLADIIAVDANPLEDIRTLENVKFVMKQGRVYKNME
ncbi:amidohydrolase family protein [Balneola sp. MJW-20]|uniref:metal-dependent hydrolase family protein n=1 Tax=Gracilimonas aurantiaca TaxID=3234185 RepID=UPI00346747D6